MSRTIGIRTQILLIVVISLTLLAGVLQGVNSYRERQTLIDASRKQSLAVAATLEETFIGFQLVFEALGVSTGGEQTGEMLELMPVTLQQLSQGFSAITATNENIEFEAIVLSSGQVLLHSNGQLSGKTADEIGLVDIPLDETVRRDVEAYDDVYITRVPLEGFDFVPGVKADLFIGAPTDSVDDALVEGLLVSFFIALIGITLVGFVATGALRRTVILPLHAIQSATARFSAGELDHHVEVRGSPETQELAQNLNQMANTLRQSREAVEALFRNMEERVQNHNRDLELSAEIGRIATGLRDISILLKETVNQIQFRFEPIYHAQIFMLDDMDEYAVLVESTGEAGRQLLILGHKLLVGGDSVIGRVTGRNEVVIASDTRRGDVPWQPNPILPETRAEMALPLSVEDRVIGALDVQSTLPDVFTEEMVRVFSVMADQVAIAIENARLLDESKQRIREINELNQRLTREAWRDFTASGRFQTRGYVYDHMDIRPLEGSEQAVGPTLNVTEIPIEIHGQSIGSLVAGLPRGKQLSQDERLLVEAVAQRVSLAIDNARLFEQTQRALAETERLYETARAVSSASELTSLFQTVVEQLSAAGRVEHVLFLLAGPDPALMQYLEVAHAWVRDAAVPEDLVGLRIPVLPLSDTEQLPVVSPETLADASTEIGASHPLRDLFDDLSSRSAALAPLNAGGRWYGLLICGSALPGGFDDPYITFTSALADQLAIAIDNRRLFEEAQIEARRARALAEAGQLASQIAGDFVTGLDNLFEAVAGPGEYDRWWFGLLAADKTVLERVTASSDQFPTVVQIADDANALAETARIEEIVLINDPADYSLQEEQDPQSLALWGKHIVMPVRIGGNLTGVLMVGRDMQAHNLDERDIQLVATLASQVAVATQNQQLFAQAESQRQSLETIVNTIPTGILVMDKQGDVVLSNENLRLLLGPEMRPGAGSQPESYPVLRSGSGEPYPTDEWPLARVFNTGETALVDDVTIRQPDGYEINVLAQAAPILDANGNVTTVVGAFQDITELQELERALQDSLRETTMLYEASRSISRASDMGELLEVTLKQVNTLAPDRVYIFLRRDERIERAATSPPDLDDGCSATVFEPLFQENMVVVHRGDAPSPMHDCLDALGLKTIGCFPLGVQRYISGWIVIGHEETYELGAEHRRFMTTLADQAAVTIENQRLLSQTEDALQNTASLYRASRIIAEARSSDNVLEAFVIYATAQPVIYAALFMIVGEATEYAQPMVEVAANWGDNLAVLPVSRRYQRQNFVFQSALEAGEITWVDDITEVTDEGVRRTMEALELQAATFIPLRTSERQLGMVLIGLRRPWMHQPNSVKAYEALADQAAVSLENARLYFQTQRRARQLTASAEVSRAVTSILQLDQLLPQVVNQIKDAFGYDHAQVFLLDEARKNAVLVASTGEAGQRLLAAEHYLAVGSQSVIGMVTERGTPQIALDTADALVVHRPNPFLPFTRSEMALPLIARGQILGAVDVQSNQPNAFTGEDIRALETLADMVATAIDNARLFELSTQRAEEMAFLFNVTTAAAISTNLDESLGHAVDTLRETMNVSSAAIFLPDESGQFLLRGAGVGQSGVETGRSTLQLDRGLVGWVARHNEAVVIGDITSDPRRLPSEGDARSVMAVPLRAAGELTGVLVVESNEINAFDDDDLRLLQTLSGSLAAIIQNSRLLREVQAANEQLLEVDRLKTNFLAAMSHELRTPLNSIIGFSRVILKGIDGPLTETQEQDLSTIYESGKHLLGLVNDILDQAKIEAGKMELSFGYFKLTDVINGVMSSAIGLTRDKALELRTEIAPDLPDTYGDEFRTRQILLNLVSNASKFTDLGSITVSAFPITTNGRNYIQVSVSDTGIGIREEDMPLLFEAFQQVDNSLTRSAEGTGMGLPLAKSLVELQYGEIWVQSEFGVGSTFSITIPTQPLEAEEGAEGAAGTQAADQAAAAATEPVRAARPTMLLAVETDIEMINLYRRYLLHAGYEVIGLTEPHLAVERIVKYRPRAVILDVNLPDHDGWAILEQLTTTAESSGTPVLVCTMNPDAERGTQLGAAGWLPKPFSEEQLRDALDRLPARESGPRVLLVDDKPESVRVFREALESQYEVLEATDGQQALDILKRTEAIKLVILDLRMPDLDGFGVLQSMRQDERTAEIPVLVLTAEDVSAAERSALDDAIDVFRKDSVDEADLLERVESRLGNPEA